MDHSDLVNFGVEYITLTPFDYELSNRQSKWSKLRYKRERIKTTELQKNLEKKLDRFEIPTKCHLTLANTFLKNRVIYAMPGIYSGKKFDFMDLDVDLHLEPRVANDLDQQKIGRRGENTRKRQKMFELRKRLRGILFKHFEYAINRSYDKRLIMLNRICEKCNIPPDLQTCIYDFIRKRESSGTYDTVGGNPEYMYRE